MKKRIFFLVLLVLVLLVSCAPKLEISDEQLINGLENLSDEERDAALAKKTLVGEAYQKTPNKEISPERKAKVQEISNAIEKNVLAFTGCTDSDGGKK